MKKNVYLIGIAAMLLAEAPLALAAPAPDQSNVVVATALNNGPYFRAGVIQDGGLPIDLAQTFTVGASGKLTGIGLQIGRYYSNTGRVEFDIATVAGGVPTSTLLASVVVDASAFPVFGEAPSTFTQVDLSPFNVQVSAGQQLAIVGKALDMKTSLAWDGNFPANYGGGDALVNLRFVKGSTWKEMSVPDYFAGAPRHGDFGFQTFVDGAAPVSPVPEPTGLVLMTSGLLAVAALRRRAQRRAS